MEWTTLETSTDTTRSITAPDRRSRWAWGNQGSPEERQTQQAKKQSLNDNAELIGAIARAAADQAIANQAQTAQQTAQGHYRSFWEGHKTNVNLTALTFVVIGLHGALTWARPVLNTLTSINNLRINPMQVLDGFKLMGSGRAQVFPIQGMTWETATHTSTWGDSPGRTGHSGHDTAAPLGTPLVAIEGGKITKVWTADGNDCGNGIKWKTADGNENKYCHMNAVAVQVGQDIDTGDYVGTVGNTGRSTGPHLHFERYENGSMADATAFLSNLSTSSNNIQVASHTINASSDIKAFLDTIAWAEGANYDTLVGGKTFNDFSRHPDIYHRASNSDAAGKYQFLKTTWDQYAKQLGLRDFSPSSQDAAAIAILEENGIPQLLAAGQVDKAFCEVGAVWASFPCNSYGQPQKSYEQLRAKYQGFGGNHRQESQQRQIIPEGISPRTNDLLNRNTRRI